MNFDELRRAAVRDASELRMRKGIGQKLPICPFDFADSLGIQTRFTEGASFEGMFVKDLNLILLPSERPYMRRVFACAHEIGHWYYGHSSKVDLMVDESIAGSSSVAEEVQADTFASNLLLPNRLLKVALNNHKLNSTNAEPQIIYEMSCWLGVSYQFLVSRLERHMTVPSTAIKTTPRKIGHSFGIADLNGRLSVHLKCEPQLISLEVGDLLLLPRGSKAAHSGLQKMEEISEGSLFEASAPGVGVCNAPSWGAPVRIMEAGYTGLSVFRNLER